MTKKSYFRANTKGQTKALDFKHTDSVVEALGLDSNQYTIISQLVPRGFDSARKYHQINFIFFD